MSPIADKMLVKESAHTEEEFILVIIIIIISLSALAID